MLKRKGNMFQNQCLNFLSWGNIAFNQHITGLGSVIGIVQHELFTSGRDEARHGVCCQAGKGGARRLHLPVSDTGPGQIKRLVLRHQIPHQLPPLITNSVATAVPRLELCQPWSQVVLAGAWTDSDYPLSSLPRYSPSSQKMKGVNDNTTTAVKSLRIWKMTLILRFWQIREFEVWAKFSAESGIWNFAFCYATLSLIQGPP